MNNILDNKIPTYIEDKKNKMKFQLTPFVKRSEERKHQRSMFVVCESSVSDLERKCILTDTIYHLCCLLMALWIFFFSSNG